MRLVEFLIYLLAAQGETLKRLAALLGEDVLVALLEELPEDPRAVAPLSRRTQASFLLPMVPGKPKDPEMDRTLVPLVNPYQELEGAVREMRLPAVLEFYLWGFPLYRAYIESSMDLNSRLPSPANERAIDVVEEAVQEARNWQRRLPVPPQLGFRVDQATKTPWLKFRSDVLKHLGSRPMQVLAKVETGNAE